MNDAEPILISGGGATAELMACALAQSEIPCRIITPQTTIGQPAKARTIALWHGALQTLNTILGSDDFLQDGHPINAMSIIDENGTETSYLPEDAAIDENFFGYNINLNALTQRAIERNKSSDYVEYIPSQTKQLLSAGSIRTTDNETYSAPLIIVAEGKDSSTAAQAGITPIKYHANTQAIIAVVRHELPHEGFAREYHRKPGPLAFVPMDEFHSSIVWVHQNSANIQPLLQDNNAFIEQLNKDSRDQLKIVAVIESPKTIPLTSRQTCTFRAERLALIGESAHKMPPTGAQGLNLSIRDIDQLSQLIHHAHHQQADVGSNALLRQYSAARMKDNLAVSSAVHLGNASIRLGGPLGWLRRTIQQQVMPQFPNLQQSLIRRALFGF